MTLQWLGQGQVMVFPAGHIYRGVWLRPGRPTDIPCPLPQSSLDEVRNILKTLAGGQWEDPVVFQTPNVFDLLQPYGEWPADRRTVQDKQANECVIFAQMTPITDVQVPIDLLRTAIPGMLVNFWDQTSGQRLVDPATQILITPPVGPSTPPFVPPPGPINVTPGIPAPPPAPEKKFPIVGVAVAGLVIVGAIALLSSSR